MCQFSSLKTTPGQSFLPHLSLYINYHFVWGSLVCILVSTPAGEISEECTLGKAPVPHSAHGMLSCKVRPGSLRHYPDRAWKFLKAGGNTNSLDPAPAAKATLVGQRLLFISSLHLCVSLYQYFLSSSPHILQWRALTPDDLFIDSSGLCHGDFFCILQWPIQVNYFSLGVI